jgi:hypothetical protein
MTPVIVTLRRAAVDQSMLLRVDAGRQPASGWTDRKHCRDRPIEWWFETPAAGAAICRRCPVRLDCLAATLASEDALALDYIAGYIAIPANTRRTWLRARRRPRAECGTEGGYRRHRRLDEDACDACKAGWAAAEQRRCKRRAGRKLAFGLT